MIINLKLPTLKQNEHPEQYEDVAKFIDMGNWLLMKWIKRQKYHFNAVSGIKLDNIETYICQFWRVCCKSM